MKQYLSIMLIVISVILLAACGSGEVRLDITPSVVIHYFDRPDSQIQTVDAGAYFDMEYTWKVGPNFTPPSRNLRAFVHFRDNTGNLIIDDTGSTVQDDHDFPIPINEWTAGEDVVYTRKRLKFNENLGSRNFLVNLYVGIYDASDTSIRAELNSGSETQPENKAYLMATFRIRRNPKIYPRYNDMWHGPEPENENHRWSKKESVVTFLRDTQAPAAELWLSGHSPIEDLEAPEQRLWLYMHEKRPEFLITKEPLVFPAERVELMQIPIPVELYETYTDRDIRIIFEVDQVLVPDPTDERDVLGFRVHEMLLLPKNLER